MAVDVHCSTEEDNRHPGFFFARELELPHDRERQDENDEIRDDIHGSVGQACLRVIDAVTWGVGKPVLGARRTAKDLGEDVCEEVSSDEEHRCPGKVPEDFVHREETEVEYED